MFKLKNQKFKKIFVGYFDNFLVILTKLIDWSIITFLQILIFPDQSHFRYFSWCTGVDLIIY